MSGVVPCPQTVEPGGEGPLRVGTRPRVVVGSEDLLGLAGTVAGLLDRLRETAASAQVGGEGELVLELVPEPPAGAIAPRGTDPLDEPDARAAVRERHELVVDGRRATVRAVTGEGLFRGATTFAQLMDADRAVPAVRIVDGPATAWRGLSLDVVRRFFTVEHVKKVVDLLALYKFNVLHLTDSQAWRLEIPGRPRLLDPATWARNTGNGDGRQHYTREDFQEIVAYATARFVTVVPELDMPGHTLSAVRAFPELQGEDATAHKLLAYLDPRASATTAFVEEVVAELAALAPGPYLHLGGDEAFGMPEDLYARFVARSLETGRATGKKVVVWQEASRSGALTHDDLVQAWIGADEPFDAEAVRRTSPPEYHDLIDIAAKSFEDAHNDVPRAVAAGSPVIASPNSVLYLDRRYAEDSLLEEQSALRTTVGLGSYKPRTSRELFGWHPGALPEIPDGARVAGIEAAIWCESVRSFDDLAFLLLPRLAGIAEKAWTPAETTWDDYRARVAAHPVMWERLGWDGYYRSTDVF